MKVRWLAMAGLLIYAAVSVAAPVSATYAPVIELEYVTEPVFGARMAVYQAGRNNPRTIVLVHGVGDDGVNDFADHIGWLAQSYHVLAMDLPGFGQSSKANELYSPANYARVVKFIADRYARKPFVLLGHSLGGVVSLRYAAQYPADLSRLVVGDTPGVLHRSAYANGYFDLAEGAIVESGPFEQIGRIARSIMTHVEQSISDPQKVLSSPSLRRRLLFADPKRIAALGIAMENLSEALPAIQTETLIVWGENDPIAPLRTAQVLWHVLPNARLVVIPAAGHTPMRQTPARYREVLSAFLQQPVAPAVATVDDVPAESVGGRPRRAQCNDANGAVFEGDYEVLTIKGCRNVRIRNARIGELRLASAEVEIDDSDIGGADASVGVRAQSSTVTMTNGTIEGDVGISAISSRFDLAGVVLRGREAAAKAPEGRSTVLFSVSRAHGERVYGAVHGVYAVAPEAPL